MGSTQPPNINPLGNKASKPTDFKAEDVDFKISIVFFKDGSYAITEPTSEEQEDMRVLNRLQAMLGLVQEDVKSARVLSMFTNVVADSINERVEEDFEELGMGL